MFKNKISIIFKIIEYKMVKKSRKIYVGYKGKYVKGLSGKKLQKRKKELSRNQKLKKIGNKKVYQSKYWKTDKYSKSKKSGYTLKFHRKYGDNVKTLSQISKATGFPISCLRKVYNKGLAAWASGHRPGASQHAWAMARVYSFCVNGKTTRTADKKLYESCKKLRKSRR